MVKTTINLISQSKADTPERMRRGLDMALVRKADKVRTGEYMQYNAVLTVSLKCC